MVDVPVRKVINRVAENAKVTAFEFLLTISHPDVPLCHTIVDDTQAALVVQFATSSQLSGTARTTHAGRWTLNDTQDSRTRNDTA